MKAARTANGGLKIITAPSTDGDAAALPDRALSDLVMGHYLPSAKVASVWFGQMAVSANADTLAKLHRRYGIRETVILVLAQDGKWVHLLELYFDRRLDPGQARLVNSLAGTLSETWKQRAGGLFSETLLSRRPEAPNLTHAVQILSDENPAGLSRAEFRVSLLLSNGLNREAVCDELNIRKSTLRSHLRQICAKTNCRSATELTHLLLLASTRPGLAAGGLGLRRSA